MTLNPSASAEPSRDSTQETVGVQSGQWEISANTDQMEVWEGGNDFGYVESGHAQMHPWCFYFTYEVLREWGDEECDRS